MKKLTLAEFDLQKVKLNKKGLDAAIKQAAEKGYLYV